MPSWGEIGHEIRNTQPGEGSASQFDLVRRKYLGLLHGHTGRNVILYGAKWTQVSDPPPPANMVAIADGDIQGFMEAVYGLGGGNLDIIIHSPGGSGTAAEAIVTYLRSKFTHIRVIVPHMAMSAATMIAMAADEIVMGRHSFLGPIDPQITLMTGMGLRSVPAQAIIEQFERAQQECADPAKLRAWMPMLNQYGPDLLISCQKATDLGKHLVENWLKAYMFASEAQGAQMASDVANWLSKHDTFKSHGRTIGRSELESKGIKIKHLEDDQTCQDLVLSVFHATTHTFTATSAVKMVESHTGKAWMLISGQAQVVISPQMLKGMQLPAQAQPAVVPKPKRWKLRSPIVRE